MQVGFNGLRRAILGGMAGLLLASGVASAAGLTLQNWKFNPLGTGVGGSFSPIDQITLLGLSEVVSAAAPAPGVTFVELGTFSATGFQNDSAPILPGVTGLGVSYELTAVLNATGVNTTLAGTDQNFVFNTASLDIYVDASLDYSTPAGRAASFNGADNGTLIGSFSLITGGGDLDFGLVTPDGSVDILFQADFLAAGTWFNEGGTDLSTLVALGLAVGLTDSNNNVVAPTAAQIAEWGTILGADSIPTTPPDFTRLYTNTDGSFAPGVVPEPSTLILFGSSLLGLALFGRKRLLNKKM